MLEIMDDTDTANNLSKLIMEIIIATFLAYEHIS